ncbi:MAG TPA: EpsI family protein [Terriglobales bacterium]|nr:EpsI family protein [Terriglobales bacterium]
MLARVFTVGALLVATAIFLHSHVRPETNPPREELASFPLELEPWSGVDLSISNDVRVILGDGDFLNRSYSAPDGSSVALFIAYFPSQRSGDTIHSPKNCLPGAGWIPLEASRATIPGLDHRPLEINRYIVGNDKLRLLVLYWYQAHNRVTASEYRAKWYMLLDSLKLNRSDGALVRIMTPTDNREDVDAAQQRAVDFAELILPLLDDYIPH